MFLKLDIYLKLKDQTINICHKKEGKTPFYLLNKYNLCQNGQKWKSKFKKKTRFKKHFGADQKVS